MTRRRTHGLAAIALGLCLGCQGTASDPLEPLPPLPDLTTVDDVVRRQLGERYRFVEQQLRNPAASPQGLGWAFGQLARAFHAYQLLEPAKVCYRNAYLLDPEDFRWAYQLAHVERSLGRLEDATELLLKVLTQRPDDVPSRVWLGENRFDQGQLEAAEARFSEALELDPECHVARLGLARIALARDLPRRALPHLESLLAAQPEATPVHHALVQTYRRLGEVDASRQILGRIPVDENARVPLSFADPLLQEISDLRRSAQYHARRGRMAISRGHFQLAVRELAAAVAANPDRPETRYNLAASLLRLGRQAEARRHLGELRQRFPDYLLGHLLEARLLEGEGDRQGAERLLIEARQADPQAARVHLALGHLYQRQGRSREASLALRRAHQLAPELATSADDQDRSW